MYDKSIVQDEQGYWVNERRYDRVDTSGPMSFDEARIKYDSLPPDDIASGGVLVFDEEDELDAVDCLVLAALREATQC